MSYLQNLWMVENNLSEAMQDDAVGISLEA